MPNVSLDLFVCLLSHKPILADQIRQVKKNIVLFYGVRNLHSFPNDFSFIMFIIVKQKHCALSKKCVLRFSPLKIR